ncbi:unnamed protein product, partial [Prorocentrum cordatum]
MGASLRPPWRPVPPVPPPGNPSPDGPTPPKGPQTRLPKVAKDGALIKLEDICVGEESGWRPADLERVNELKEVFLTGQYGIGLLKAPSVIQQDGQAKTGSDGRQLLSDGKSTILAMTAVKAIHASGEGANYEWSGALLDAFENGIKVSVLEYPEDDHDLVVAHNALTHDTDSNRYRSTTVKDMADVANRFRNKVPGGDWNAAQESLLQVYGKSKRAFVWRMVCVAQTMKPPVLQKVVDVRMPNNCVWDNPYFTGHGAQADKRLSEAAMLAVLTWYEDDTVGQKGMSSKVFEQEYCAVFRQCERWFRTVKKEFGKHFEHPGVARTREFLFSGRVRVAALGCIRAAVRLEGASEEKPGIPQCRALWAELEALKKGPETAPKAGAPAAHAAAGDAAASQGPAGADDADADADAGAASIGVGMEVEEDRDPAEEAASILAGAFLDAVHVYENEQAMKENLRNLVGPSSKIVVLVDACTSKAKIPLALLEQVASVVKDVPTTKIRVLTTAAGRLELLVACSNKAAAIFPEGNQFTVQLVRSSRQTGSGRGAKRPQHVQLLMLGSPAQPTAPCQLDVSRCLAKAAECCHMRCRDETCPLRSVEEQAALAALVAAKDPRASDPSREIPEDDKAGDAEDAEVADDEGG